MKNKIKVRNKLKANKGITLIALVITIIVLLILVAVTIATLTGENGILTKANTAKEQSEIEEIKERAKTDILGVQAGNENANITKKQFIEILNDYFNNVPTAEELPEDLSTLILTTKVEYGSRDIKVSDIWNRKFGEEDTPVISDFDENTFTLGTNESDARNTDKYGWKVPEYTVTTKEFTIGVWRLFYQDNNYTYLITDELVGRYILIGTANNVKNGEELKYKTGEDVGTIGRKLNSKISSLFTVSNDSNSIKVTACLTDTSDLGLWNEYKNGDAVFAIGAPTLELFAASHNNISVKKWPNKISFELDTYGYKKIGAWPSYASDGHGIYNKDHTTDWCIASPSSEGKNDMWYLDGFDDNLSGYCDVYDKIVSIRPVVCIPTSVFNSKYTLENL